MPGNSLYAQKTKRAEGSSKIMVENNMTREQTEIKVKERAMVNAIESVFGTYVEQITDISIKSGRVSYNIIGGTQVKGEWVETIDINFEDFGSKDDKTGKIETWIQCTIKGRVKRATPKANVVFEILSCPEKTCRKEKFHSGESLYVYFKSPVDGYLTIYLDDGSMVYRMLPYNSAGSQKTVFVEGDKEYIFFSNEKEHNYFEDITPDEIELYTTRLSEYNNLYFTFSESNYIKPLLNSAYKQEEYIIPKSLTTKEFQKWLARNRATITDFLDLSAEVEIVYE
jgi:hypothetical protein